MVRYTLSDVFRWAYKPSVNFYFEVKNEASDAENFVFTFLTQEVRSTARWPVVAAYLFRLAATGIP